MTTIVKAADAAEFLSLVPTMFGFTPTRSVVAIPFAHGRSAGGMRVDLPPGPDVDALAASVVGMVCRVAEADAFMLIVYDGVDAVPVSTAARVTKAFRHRADACGLHVIDALHVGATRWRSCIDRKAGGDLADLPVPPAGAGDVPPAGDQHSGADVAPAPPERCAAVAEATLQLLRAMSALLGLPEEDDVPADARIAPEALAATALLDDVPLFFETTLVHALDRSAPSPHPDVPEPYLQAALLWCLGRPSLRDIALCTWLDGLEAGDDALECQLRWEDGHDYPESRAQRMWGEGPRPDLDRLLAALGLCREAAAVGTGHARAGALAAAAWLAWALGRMTHAEIYARGACEAEERHGLGTIVLTFIAAGHLPDWAFHG